MNILVWLDGATDGPFQRLLPDGRIFSDLMNKKPVFSFPFSSIEYIQAANRFLVDGVPMTPSQADEVSNAINSVEPPAQWFKSMKQNDISSSYQQEVLAITGNVDPTEMTSWSKQEEQARAYIADQSAVTPLLDGLLIGRGLNETKLELAQKIVNNADAYQAAYSTILGRYQARMKTLQAATTISEINAVVW